MTKSNEMESLLFEKAEIKPELRDEDRLWDVYISQNQDGILKSDCWSVVRHVYGRWTGSRLVRVYEGLNKEVAYGVNSRVFDNTRQLYVELGILPSIDKAEIIEYVFNLSEEEKDARSQKMQENSAMFKDEAQKFVTELDLELLVEGAQGTLLIPGRIVQQKCGDPIQHYEIRS